MNKFLHVVITAPLSSKFKNYKENPILVSSQKNGLKLVPELIVFHIRSISKDRLIEKIGGISNPELTIALDTLRDSTTL